MSNINTCLLMGHLEKDVDLKENEFKLKKEETNEIFFDFVLPSCRDFNIKPYKVDFVSSINKLETVKKAMLRADILIIDLRYYHQDIMYELGIRDFYSKPIIQIVDNSRKQINSFNIFNIEDFLANYSSISVNALTKVMNNFIDIEEELKLFIENSKLSYNIPLRFQISKNGSNDEDYVKIENFLKTLNEYVDVYTRKNINISNKYKLTKLKRLIPILTKKTESKHSSIHKKVISTDNLLSKALLKVQEESSKHYDFLIKENLYIHLKYLDYDKNILIGCIENILDKKTYIKVIDYTNNNVFKDINNIENYAYRANVEIYWKKSNGKPEYFEILEVYDREELDKSQHNFYIKNQK